jgi:hypothetical protein
MAPPPRRGVAVAARTGLVPRDREAAVVPAEAGERLAEVRLAAGALRAAAAPEAARAGDDALALRRGAAVRVDGESTGVVVGLAAGSALAWGLTTGTAAAAEAGTAVAGAAGALAEEAVVLLGITASSCSAGGA